MSSSSRVMAIEIESPPPDESKSGYKPKKVFFEVAEVEVVGGRDGKGWANVAAGHQVQAEEASASLAEAVDAVKPIAARIVDAFRALGEAAPEEIEVTLGVKLSGKVGFFVAESQGEASVGLKLKWKGKAT